MPTTTEAHLLEYVCWHPAEDDARLVLCDWWEDHGQSERAEFCRLQIELHRRCFGGWTPTEADVATMQPLLGREQELMGTDAFLSWCPPVIRDNVNESRYRRGFIAEVSLTAEAFAGGPCGRCGGTGQLATGKSAGQWFGPTPCPDCRGTGRTPGCAAALFRAAPIEKVTLSDKRPAQGVYPSESWYWEEGGADFWFLPRDLFDLLAGHRRAGQRTDQYPSRQRHYDTGQAARDALGAAALLLGRRRGWPCPTCLTPDGQTGYLHDDCSDCGGSGHTVTLVE